MLVGTSSMIFGAIILISVLLPWFLIGVFFILIIYIYAAAFYRASARELKVCRTMLTHADSYDLYCSFSDLVNIPSHENIFSTKHP